MPRLIGKQKKARYVSRSVENWRRLKNYPNYEVSNYGRVRASARVDADSFLKPRWFRGKPFVVLTDKDGARCERAIYWLMSDAGWIEEKRKLWLGMDVKNLRGTEMSDLHDMYATRLRLLGIERVKTDEDEFAVHAKVCPANPDHIIGVYFHAAADGLPNKCDTFCYGCITEKLTTPSLSAVLKHIG